MARRNILSNSNPDTEEKVQVEFDKAVAILKASRNRTFFLRIQTYAPVKEDTSKVFNLTGHVKVNCAEAIRALDSMYGERFRKEAFVELSIYKSCIFVG